MKLSDSYMTQVETPALELKVVQMNIRTDHNKELVLLREAERMGGFEQGMERGLRILVNTLKELCPDLRLCMPG